MNAIKSLVTAALAQGRTEYADECYCVLLDAIAEPDDAYHAAKVAVAVRFDETDDSETERISALRDIAKALRF